MRASLLLLLCLMSLTTFAQGDMATMSSMNMSTGPALGATAAFDAKGRLWVVDEAHGHVQLRYSDDFGKTLITAVDVNAIRESISDSGENRPKIALGANGEIYVSWTQPLSRPYTGRIRFARSLDEGKHFSAPITVHHDRAIITHRFDALAVDAKGHVLVAWIDKRDLNAARTAGRKYLGAAVYYAWSDNQGASFAPERKLADHSCTCCRIALAHAPDGGIGTFWRSVYPGDIRDHTYAELKYGSVATESARATFNQWQIAACPEQGPGLAIGADGTLHAVWYEAKGRPTIWYGQLDPGHPPQHAQVVATLGAGHADVTAHGKMVWITWNQVNAQGYALMLKRSTDDGLHFDPARTIATVTGEAGSPQWVMWKDRPYVAWNTTAGFRLIAVDGGAH